MPGWNNPGTVNLVPGRDNAVWLNPAHVKRKGDEDKYRYRQGDAHGQKLDRAIGVVTVLDQAEHAGAEAEQDQQ